jgi:uncharacterized protein YjiS (DUF1127 family)
MEESMREAASFIAHQNSAFAEGLIPGLIAMVGETYRRWKDRGTVATLSEFDDRMLADIGLKRDDVQRALDLPFSDNASLALQRLAFTNRLRGWNV